MERWHCSEQRKFLATEIGFLDLDRWGQGKGKMKSMDKLILLDIALYFNISFRLKELK